MLRCFTSHRNSAVYRFAARVAIRFIVLHDKTESTEILVPAARAIRIRTRNYFRVRRLLEARQRVRRRKR